MCSYRGRGTIYLAGGPYGPNVAIGRDGKLKWSKATAPVFASPIVASDGTIYGSGPSVGLENIVGATPSEKSD